VIDYNLLNIIIMN